MTPLEENQEFTNTSGSITFTTGEETKPIVLEAISDKLPEFIESFVLRLVNISGEFKIKVTYLSDFYKFVLKTLQLLSIISLRWLPGGGWTTSRDFSECLGFHPFQ